jgi:hypothetical protein
MTRVNGAATPDFAIIPIEAAANPYLPATVRVLIALCALCRQRWTGADRVVEASLNELKAITKLADRRDVRRCTRRAQDAGLIRIEPLTTASSGGYDRTRYVLIGSGVGADADTVPVEEGVGTDADRGVGANADRVSANLTPLLKEEKPIEKRTPSSEGVRAREGEVFSNEVDRRQGTLLLPTTGGGDRKARLAVIKSYNPSPALIERAAELGVNARAEDVFGKWQRHRIATNRLPLDFDAAEADFENWIRDEAARFGLPEPAAIHRRSHRTSLVQSALNRARAYDG